MSAELTFYTNPNSRGRIVRWMLEEIGAPYRTEFLDYGAAMKSAEYLAINPMGKVPTIKHGNTVVTECAAICAYLADAFPDAGLAPPQDKRGDYYRWLFFAAGPLEAATTIRSLALEVPADREVMVGYGTYDRALGALSEAVTAHPYIAGPDFSAADVYVGSQIGFGLRFGILEERPAFTGYFARVSDRDAFRRADEIENAAAEA